LTPVIALIIPDYISEVTNDRILPEVTILNDYLYINGVTSYKPVYHTTRIQNTSHHHHHHHHHHHFIPSK